MNWIGGAIVGVFLLGLIFGNAFSRQRQNSEANGSHASKLDYPSTSDQEASIAALTRAQIASAKDSHSRYQKDTAQAERAYRINVWTAIGVGTYTAFTAVIVVFNVVQYGETHRYNRRQSTFFANQLEIMQGQLSEMQAARRPWLTIEGNPAIASDFTYSENGATIALNFILQNTGATPAINAFVNSDVFPVMPPYPQQARDHSCSIFSKDLGIYVFPGEKTPPWTFGATLTRESTDKFWGNTPSVKPMIFPTLFSCIVYKDTFSNTIHHTPFVFQLQRVRSENPNRSAASIFVDEGTVSAGNLHLIKWIIWNQGID